MPTFIEDLDQIEEGLDLIIIFVAPVSMRSCLCAKYRFCSIVYCWPNEWPFLLNIAFRWSKAIRQGLCKLLLHYFWTETSRVESLQGGLTSLLAGGMDLQVQTGTHELVVCPAVGTSCTLEPRTSETWYWLTMMWSIVCQCFERGCWHARIFVYVFVLEQSIGDW